MELSDFPAPLRYRSDTEALDTGEAENGSLGFAIYWSTTQVRTISTPLLSKQLIHTPGFAARLRHVKVRNAKAAKT